MNISISFNSKNLFNMNYMLKNNHNQLSFGKTKQENNDNFSYSDKKNLNKSYHIKGTRISEDLKKAILDHYKSSINDAGDIGKFCKDHNITYKQYKAVIVESGLEEPNNSLKMQAVKSNMEKIKYMVAANKLVKKFKMN